MMPVRARPRIPTWALLSLLLAAPLPLREAAAEERPIVAVFNLQAQGTTLDTATLQALTDFLAARLAETGRYRTLPRDQIKARLTQAKLESYRDCYDQSCQIELGRELAAQKTLAAKLIRAGERCVLTLELFDLKTATAEAAATEQTLCGVTELFRAITAGVQTLARASSPATAEATSAPVAAPKVTLVVRSQPKGAQVLLDGLYRGTTPVRIAVVKDQPLRLSLSLDGHQPETRRLRLSDADELHVPLRLTAAGRRDFATTSEWFGIGLGPSYLSGAEAVGMGISFRLFNLKWYRFFWTLMELNAALTTNSASNQDSRASMSVGTRFGYPIYLGARGQHQLLAGLSFEYTITDGAPVDGTTPTKYEALSLFSLGPGVDYNYNAFDGTLPLGFGVRVHLPVAGAFSDLPRYPATVVFTFNIGLSLYRLMKGTVRAAMAKQQQPQPAENETP